MVDTPGNSSTTRTIAVGQTVSDTLETVNDHDWFRITLTAGQSITIVVDGITLVDPYLYVRDSNGNLLHENDDSGGSRDSRLSFTASQSGTYFIDVAAWVPPPSSPDYPGYTGTYNLSVSVYTPPPVATIDQVANQLVSGYWDGDSHHFNVTQGGSITVNLSALTPAGQTLARAALATWTDIIGVTFPEVITGGKIVFDDDEEGAHSSGIWSNGIITSADVNVSTDWLSQYGTGLNSYSFQTYIHEIGHALGLGHAGDYNGQASYPYDALFQNDGWPLSIMSYFNQSENSFFANQGFTETFILTPMLSDVVAMSMLYGLSTTTRTGNTTYGFNSNAGRDQFNASMHQDVAYTIFDSGGIDTLDYSGFGQNQRINLNPETFSNVGGLVGNVSIGRGVVIENAIGGSGADQLIGNNAGNVLRGNGGADTLTGGLGNDTFQDTASGLNGDTITDFGSGDRIVISNASLAGFSFSLSGSTLTYTGGKLTLTGFNGQLQASGAAGGGVQLTLAQVAAMPVRADFNGDGRDDVLLRHDSGTITDWLGQSNGTFFSNHAAATYNLGTSWSVAGTGDFNGDGRDDVLLRNDNGSVTDWLGQADGSFFGNHAAASYALPSGWDIAGTGDFNGDNRDDVLLRHDNGTITEWLGQANGGFASNHTIVAYALDVSWDVVGTGDFNGDGRDDLLLRHDNGTLTNWLGEANGSFFSNHAAASYSLPAGWDVAGIGDFNGDGRDDVLLRHDNGTITDWLGQANGSFFSNHAAANYSLSSAWEVAGIGDYNGDNRDDLLLRHDNGTVTDWLGQANGGFFSNHAAANYSLPDAWQVQPEGLI